MADDTQTAAPPQDDAIAQALRLAQILQGQQQQPAAPQQQDRSFVSLLGSALGSGSTAPTVDEEDAGRRALMSFGINMLQAGGPSLVKRSFGQALAQGLSGAGESEMQSQQMAAARLGAQQEYQQKQQEMRLAALKEAIPLLTLQQQRKMMGLPKPLAAGGGTPSIGAVTGGAPDTFASSFAPLAQTIADKTGLPLNYVLGQAGLETGWGSSGAAKNNNFFGVTDPKTGKPATYATPEEGANAYIQLMASDRYKNVPRTGTPAEIGDRMALAGYNPNVPAKDKTDSYGQRVGNFAAALGRPAGGAGTATAATPPPATPTPPAASTAPARETFVKDPATGTVRKVTVPVQTPPAAPPGVIQTDQPAGGATVAGPPGTAIVGAAKPAGPAVSGDVNTMIRGMIGAGANATTLAPGAATSGPVAPPAVVAAATPQGATPPATTTTPPVTPTPQVTTQQPTPASGGPLTFEQFQAQHPISLTDAERGATTVTADPAAMAAAENVKNAAAQELQRARAGIPGADAGKALAAYNTANDKIAQIQQQARIETANLQQKQLQSRVDQQRQLYTAQMEREQAVAEAERNRQAEADRLTQSGQQAIALENVKTGNATSQHLQEAYNTDAANSGKRIDDLELLRGLSDNAGSPTLLSAIKVGDRSLADIISATGFGGKDLQDKVGAIQAFRAGVLNTVRELRTGGAATGEPRSNQDLQFVQDMAPNEWQKPETRGAIISFLQQVNQRRIDMAAEVARLSATRGPNGQLIPAGEAVAQARKNLPDFVPPMPAEGLGNSPAALQTRQKFFNENVPPHSFFRYPNGRIDLYNGPGG